jgi:para-nitrobenzyl esterase
MKPRPVAVTIRAVAAGLLLATGAGRALSADAPSVRTEAGAVDGLTLPSGVRAFLGVPYAAPPVRDLRWRAPAPVAPWQGTRHADRFGPQCPQPLRGVLTNQYSGAEVVSEDCLYLNVWAARGARKAPVIAYLHGGAWFIGSGSMPLYSGEMVAGHGAVVVNLNYRLGVLGFLAHPELTAESPQHASGNYALLDQVAALQWIRRNIAAFGGDPDHVTIVGQSAGAAAVQLLQVSPLATGLFHRAFAMSAPGAGQDSGLPDLASAEGEGRKVQAYLKAPTLAAMRALPVDRLALPWRENIASVGPALDGHVLTRQVTDAFARGEHHDVPLVVGFTRDEVFGGFGRVVGLADYIDKVRRRFGARADSFLALYPASNDAEAVAQARAADHDGTAALGMFQWATRQVRQGRHAVFAYEFARAHRYAPGVSFTDLDPGSAGAYHTSEVPFWLGTLDSFDRYRTTRAWNAADRDLSRRMIESLVAFAKTGDPSTAGLQWPRFAVAAPRLLEIADTAAVASWPDPRKLAFFAAESAGQPSAPAAGARD